MNARANAGAQRVAERELVVMGERGDELEPLVGEGAAETPSP
jgi:hypothetical protein